MSDSGLERFRRIKTRILTEGVAGNPLPPPPVGGGPIFVMASFRVWDVEDPENAEQIGIVADPQIGFGNVILKDGDTCWCADPQGNLASVDVEVTTAPVVLDQLQIVNCTNQGLAIDGAVLYLISGVAGGVLGENTLYVINASNPSNISVTTSYEMLTAFAVVQRFPRAIANYSGTHRLYIVSAESGFNTVFASYNATTPGAITQQGTLNLVVAPAFSQAAALAINHPLVYALLTGNGTSVAAALKIIDVTDPAAPSVLSTTTIGLATDRMRELQIDGTTLYIGGSTLNDSVGDPSKILTYDVTNSAAPSLSATLTLTGITRPLTSMFIRDDVAYVGSAGDSEASAYFSIWDFTDGLQFQSELGAAAVSGVALTGDA